MSRRSVGLALIALAVCAAVAAWVLAGQARDDHEADQLAERFTDAMVRDAGGSGADVRGDFDATPYYVVGGGLFVVLAVSGVVVLATDNRQAGTVASR